jgi:hypothetical protein
MRQTDDWEDWIFEKSHIPVKVLDAKLMQWIWLEWVNKALCIPFGHEVIADQCMKPEHDYCLYCNRLVPHGADEERATYHAWLTKRMLDG